MRLRLTVRQAVSVTLCCIENLRTHLCLLRYMCRLPQDNKELARLHRFSSQRPRQNISIGRFSSALISLTDSVSKISLRGPYVFLTG